MESTLSLLIASSMALLSVVVLAERTAWSARLLASREATTATMATLGDPLTNAAADLARDAALSNSAALAAVDDGLADDATADLARVDGAALRALDHASDRLDDLAFLDQPRPAARDIAALDAALNRCADHVADLAARFLEEATAQPSALAEQLTNGAADAADDREAAYPVTSDAAAQAILDRMADLMLDLMADQAADHADGFDRPIALSQPDATQPLALLERKLAADHRLLPEEVPFASFLLQATSNTGSAPQAQPHLPLVERHYTSAERAEPLADDLRDAIGRIEPILDQTRDADDATTLRIRAGTASMTSAFGDGWHVASDDPSVDVKAARFGLVWRAAASASCDDYVKLRRREFGGVALDGLSTADCQHLQAGLARSADDAAAIPVAPAPLSLPAFSAPLPGGRASSESFWLAQRERIKAIEARLESKWRLPTPTAEQVGLRF